MNTNIPNLIDTDVEKQTGGVLKAKTLRHWRLVGGGPKFYKVGRRCLYRMRDVEEFLLSDERGGGVRQ